MYENVEHQHSQAMDTIVADLDVGWINALNQSLLAAHDNVSLLMATNHSHDISNNTDVDCYAPIPTALQIFEIGYLTEKAPIAGLSPIGIVFDVLGTILTAATIAAYIEQLVYIYSRWVPSVRRNKTIMILLIYPLISFTSLLSMFVPRCGVLVDLIHNAYLAASLEGFVQLMESYYSSADKLLLALADTSVSLRGPPCCCCCLCLPTVKINKKSYTQIRWLVLQASVIRPFLMLLAAVLWTNGNYLPGVVAPDGAYLYITILNILTTMVALYGLIRLVDVMQRHLVGQQVQTKLYHLQVVMLSTVLLSIVCSTLVKLEVIPCWPPFNSKSRGERIYHFLLILIMLPMSILSRITYLSKSSQVYALSSEQGGENGGQNHTEGHDTTTPVPVTETVSENGTHNGVARHMSPIV